MTFYSLWIGLPLLSALFQASAKMLAAEMRHMPFSWSWLVQATHSPWVVVLLASEVLSFVLLLNVLTHVPLSKAFPITAVAYIAIELMSWTLFKEPVILLQIIGSALILAGVWLISIGSKSSSPLRPPSGSLE
jgi:multidrug transporter EmrE-like cation transporter